MFLSSETQQKNILLLKGRTDILRMAIRGRYLLYWEEPLIPFIMMEKQMIDFSERINSIKCQLHVVHSRNATEESPERVMIISFIV